MINMKMPQIRKVKNLGGRAKKQAIAKGLNEEDIVILSLDTKHPLQYKIKKIEGGILKYLEDNYLF